MRVKVDRLQSKPATHEIGQILEGLLALSVNARSAREREAAFGKKENQ
jgi:hypothetical protein